MCIHNSIYALLNAWANSIIIERQQGSARRSFLLKILTTHKKINNCPYWLVENTPYFILWFEREHLIQLTDNCEWKLSSKFTGKIKKIKAKWTQVSLKKCFKSQRSYQGFWLFKIIFTLPTNLRNVQLMSFFWLYFCCLLDQDLKGQWR